MTRPARKPRQTGLQTWVERNFGARRARKLDRQFEALNENLRAMNRAIGETRPLDDRIRAIVREEIAADRLAVGPVFREAPAAAIEMAIAHEAQLAPVRDDVLRALSRARSATFKDTF